jgi:hypothetical protein
MDKFRKELLMGAVLLFAMSVAQLSSAQQHDHGDHANHTDQDSDVATVESGQVFDSSQLTQQSENTMQQRQGGMREGHQGQGEMMHGDQAGGHGNMMEGRQGQGEMMHGNQDGGQGNMMQQRQGQGNMMKNQENGDMMQRMQQMRRRMGMGGGQNASAGGQDAFSAIRSVVSQLEANPDTDWSRINIEALRNHLIDMHEVTINSEVESMDVEGGARYRVTGTGRTLQAIRNMVGMHASQMTAETEWTAVAKEIRNGMEVTVTATSDNEVAKIRALGFMGFMVSGDHHEMHHMAIAGADMDTMSSAEGGHSH